MVEQRDKSISLKLMVTQSELVAHGSYQAMGLNVLSDEKAMKEFTSMLVGLVWH